LEFDVKRVDRYGRLLTYIWLSDWYTEEDAAERHAVFFNRGVPDSQAYARGFDNRLPEEVPDGEAWR
jgi:hypothetical protein